MSFRAAIANRASPAERLRAVRDILASMTRVGEPEIESLARTFAKLAGESNRIVGLAAKIVECIGDEGVTSVVPALRALGAAEMDLIESRLQATRGILESTGVEKNVLRQLSKVTRSQCGIALKTRVLAMMTNVEVGRLGSQGKSFEYLAGELNNFSRSLSTDTGELERHTQNRRTAIEATNHVLSAELPRLAEELGRIKGKLADDLALLESDMARLGSIPMQFETCVQGIGTQIAGAVAAIQSYDITRQQIEHVDMAIVDIASEIPSGRRRKEGSRVSLGITIQLCQLRQIRETVVNWIAQVRDCLDATLKISASEVAGISPMVRARESEVSARLDHIEQMRSESKAHGATIYGTVGEHSSLVKLIEQQVKTAAVTQQTLHLLSLNAIIEGDRLGAQADTVLEIGKGILDLTQEWSRITDQSDQSMRAIAELVGRADTLTAKLSETEGQNLEQAQARARLGLECLRAASEFASSQAREIKLGLEAMRTMADGVLRSVDVLEAAHRQLDEVLSILESVQIELEVQSAKVCDTHEAEALKQHFSASYTTEMEREVLRVALGGTPLPPLRPTLEGNGVELF